MRGFPKANMCFSCVRPRASNPFLTRNWMCVTGISWSIYKTVIKYPYSAYVINSVPSLHYVIDSSLRYDDVTFSSSCVWLYGYLLSEGSLALQIPSAVCQQQNLNVTLSQVMFILSGTRHCMGDSGFYLNKSPYLYKTQQLRIIEHRFTWIKTETILFLQGKHIQNYVFSSCKLRTAL